MFAFADGDRADTAILGGKGAGLAHMTRLGLPVPPGFVVSTRAGRECLAAAELPAAARQEIEAHLAGLETVAGRALGDPVAPLLVSVRSGAPVSMPGMMDTVLNVGLNGDTVQALVRETGDDGFAWSCYQRFVESYARVVRGVGAGEVEDCLIDFGGSSPAARRERVSALLALVTELDGRPVPDDPREQIVEAVEAVFHSWDSPRAKAYRRFRSIDDGLCTAATVQAMVFGNRGETSGSGVAFTRDPSSGAAEPFGDVLFNAQGEDVVAGERDAEPLSAMAARLPDAYRRLERALATIEADARDLCEVEFTVDDGELWVLQTRVGLRSGRAAVRIAVALVAESRITAEEAIDRITPAQLEAAAAPGFAAEPRSTAVIARGLAASPGAASGKVAFDPARAVELAAGGDDIVLVRATTSPSDVTGFIAARAVVTGRGGRTSHAAVVARGMYRPAVCGVGDIKISDDRRRGELAGITLLEGDIVSVDGDRGLLSIGGQELAAPADDVAVQQMISWCQERVRVPALATADVSRLPVADTLTALEDGHGAVVIELTTPEAIPAGELVKALAANTGHAPVLRITPAWLRAADVPLRGRVLGVIVPDGSVAGSLIQTSLEPA